MGNRGNPWLLQELHICWVNSCDSLISAPWLLSSAGSLHRFPLTIWSLQTCALQWVQTISSLVHPHTTELYSCLSQSNGRTMWLSPTSVRLGNETLTVPVLLYGFTLPLWKPYCYSPSPHKSRAVHFLKKLEGGFDPSLNWRSGERTPQAHSSLLAEHNPGAAQGEPRSNLPEEP